MDFYIDPSIITIYPARDEKIPAAPFIFYGNAGAVAALAAKGRAVQKLAYFPHYAITRLKPAFLNKATRATTLDTMQVVLVH